MSSSAPSFHLPDLLANFPWPRKLSKHYAEAKMESSAWTGHFHPFNEAGLEAFNLCNLDLLASLAYSSREREVIRLGCDLLNILFIFDEYSDIEDPDGVRMIREVVLDALRNPYKPRPDGEVLLGEMVRDFWLRAMVFVKPGAPCIDHFVQDVEMYTDAVVREADDRTNGVFRTFESYVQLRRGSSGCYVCFALCEFGLDIPEHVFHHPRLAKLREQTNDLIAISNDILSYPMEKSRGLETHNSVELIRRAHNLTIQDAINWLARYVARIQDGFLENVAKVPSWGPNIDKGVKIYIDCLAHWVRGNDDWSFESGRYFGSRGLEVQKTRMMALLSPSTGYVSRKPTSV